jgi:hypothetical protein
LLLVPYTFLSSASFSYRSVEPVFLLWKGSNEHASDVIRVIEDSLSRDMSLTPGAFPFVVQDRFYYIGRRTGGKMRRPSSMKEFANALGIIYTGYSVGCSGFAELYSLGRMPSHVLPPEHVLLSSV